MKSLLGTPRPLAARGLSTWLDNPKRVAAVLLLPTILLVLGVLVYPIGRSFWMSLTDLHLTRPQSGLFIGLENYLTALRDPGFRAALGRTLRVALLTVPAETALGLLIALLLNQPFRGRGFVRGLIILPWALPYVVNGVMWKWICPPHPLTGRGSWVPGSRFLPARRDRVPEGDGTLYESMGFRAERPQGGTSRERWTGGASSPGRRNPLATRADAHPRRDRRTTGDLGKDRRIHGPSRGTSG